MDYPYSEITPSNIRKMIAVAEKAPAGAIVEIGVYKGGSAAHLMRLAKDRDVPLFVYDTFTGMPFMDEGDGHPVGDFGDTSYEEVCDVLPDATVVQGVFPASIVDMPPVAFVHADCDQYRSVKSVCEAMPARMVDGGIIYFDDYGCLEGATRAVHEFCRRPFVDDSSGKGYVAVKNGRIEGRYVA